MESFLFLLRSGPRAPQVNTVVNTIKHLSKGGNPVTVFLLQDGVLAGLDSPWANAARAQMPGVAFRVLDEDLALRGFCEHDLDPSVQVARYPDLVDAIMEGGNRVLGAL
jgi:sulfur relay protein TusB/DsrH